MSKKRPDLKPLDVTDPEKIPTPPLPPHPIQPLYDDSGGKRRFRRNEIVRYLLDKGPFDMNVLTTLAFSDEDRVQFAQLIGYSLNGFGELSYVREVDYRAAQMLGQNEYESVTLARAQALESQLKEAREGMKAGLAALFEKHPDDFGVE